MTDTPWTPGPWEVGKNEIGPQWVVWWSNYNDPASVRFLAETSREADARLIAAAPEMAELVEQLAKVQIANLQQDWTTGLIGRTWVEQARAILSRIRGET